MPADVHRDDVKHHAQQRDPEMVIGQFDGPEFGVVEAREQPVKDAEGQQSVPTQRAGVNVGDGPVRVMREGIDGLDGQGRAFQRGHAVGGDGGDHEFEHRVLADLVPGAAQGEQAVEHAAPGRRDEHDGEDHAQRLRPVRQRRVKKMMRPGPDVDEDQRPKVNDRKPVGKDRAVGRLGQVVIHHARGRAWSGRRPPRCGRTTIAPAHPARRRKSSSPSTCVTGTSRPLTMCRIATVKAVAM